MLKKLLAVIFISSVFFLTSTTKVFADTAVTDFCNTRNGNVINLETWYSGKCFKGVLQGAVGTAVGNAIGTDTTLTGSYRGFSDIVLLDIQTRIFGENPVDLTTIYSSNPSNSDSAIGTLSNLIAHIAATPPASSTDYLATVLQNIQKHSTVVPPAYAAAGPGFGFTALTPVLKAWQGLRNVAYAVYILVFVLYGFMIMFRVRIDPKVVTSFQMAIPKLIATLLLITFSYAIAGLMIDLMYLISLGIGTVLESAGLIQFRQVLGVGLKSQDMLTGNGWGFLGYGLMIIVKTFLSDAIEQIVSLVVGLPNALVGLLTLISGIGLIVRIVIGIAMLYVLFKIFFVFVQAYAKIILQIVFSPLILLGNILPGNDSFGSWVRGLFAEMSVFPSTLIMMMIGSTLIDTGIFGQSDISGSLWTPPGFGGPFSNTSILGLPLSNTGAGASALLGFGMLLLAPKVADMVRDALKVPPFKYGAALEEPLKFGGFQVFSPDSLYTKKVAGSPYSPTSYLSRAQSIVTGALTKGKYTNPVSDITDKVGKNVVAQTGAKKTFFG